MNTHFLLVATLAAAVIVTGASIAPIAHADPDDAVNATNETAEALNDSDDQDDGNENATGLGFVDQVDPYVTLAGWEYDETEQEFVLTFRADRASSVSISEVISMEDSGSQRINLQEQRLSSGETTLRMPADQDSSGEAAVVITTRRSVQQGTGTFVSTGQVDTNPLGYTSSTAGWVGGSVLSLVFVTLAGAYKMRKERSSPEVA